MSLKEVKSLRTGERYFYLRHPTGLRIYLYPKAGSASSFAVFGARYGSIDNRFRVGNGAEETVPEGIAHYLEHKLFESEDGDAFARFAKTGASANAFTSFESTCYLFSCSDRLYDALEILLDFVQKPYFTAATVEKERGIIGQEIRMYEDDPGWRVMFNYLKAMYHAHPIQLDIAGTAESIAKITPEHLYRCYETFYRPENMVLSLCGDFDTDRVLSICDRLLTPGAPMQVERLLPHEPDEIVTPLMEERLSVGMPIFQFGYKSATPGDRLSEKDTAAMEVLLEALASDGSPLFEKLLSQELVSENSFSYEFFEGSGFATPFFSGESRDPKAAAALIREEIEHFVRNGVPREDFELAKRSLYGASVTALNSVSEIANGLLNLALRGRDLFAYIDALAELTLEDVEKCLSVFREDRAVLSVIEPLSEDGE